MSETSSIEVRSQRQGFKREPVEKRRSDLIQAVLDCVIEKGLRAATVREVAARAGVTNGLVRYYFSSKDQMIQEAYRATMRDMTAAATAAVEQVEDDPKGRLRALIVASHSTPVLTIRNLSLWASFISLIHVDEKMAEIHRETYRDFRKAIERLIADVFIEAGRPIRKKQLERYGIKINAVLDGLWLEGCLAGDLFDVDELAAMSIEAVEAILDISLHDEVREKAKK